MVTPDVWVFLFSSKILNISRLNLGILRSTDCDIFMAVYLLMSGKSYSVS